MRQILQGAVLLVVSAALTGSPVAAADGKPLRVALVQMAVRPTLAENRDRMVEGIVQAAERQARVAVFPEGALRATGDERGDAVNAAVDAVCRAARDSGIYVVSGAHTWLPSVKRAANWMFAAGPDGRELLRYEKLYDNHRAAMPGVFWIDGVPCSAAICADRWLRGVVEIPIQQGAQIVFELSNNYACEWVEPYGWYWNAPLARRNSVWSIFCNSGNAVSGKAPPQDHLKHGHSAIIAPDGRVVAATHSDAEAIVVADLNPGLATRQMARARSAHPALREFWQAGERLQRGEAVPAPPLVPLKSPAANITLAAAAIAGDVARIESLIAEARQRGADLLALPARAIREDELGRLREAARQSGITVVVGAVHQQADGERNSAFVISPAGQLLTRYDQLSAEAPFVPGSEARAMWFRVQGLPAVVTLERDALWTELAELAAVAGAQLHVHLDHVAESGDAAQQRLQTWVGCASFATFTATVSNREAILWDDLHGREESRAEVKGTPRPDSGPVEVYSPFSANLVARAAPGELVIATRHVSQANPHHPHRTANMNPQMKAWYELGAQLVAPR